MDSPSSIDNHNAQLGPAHICVVCGGAIPAGEGLAVRHGQVTLWFKCEGCLERFNEDSARFLTDHPAECCDDHPASVTGRQA
ncbi:MAG: hypothetical protein WEE67_08565 [Chloroflexota bacterium]